MIAAVVAALSHTATAVPARVEVRALPGETVPPAMIDTLRIHLDGAATIELGPPLTAPTLSHRIDEASGALAAGGVVVPAYHTNSPDECRYVVDHAGARAIIVENAAQLEKIEAVRGELPGLEHVVSMEPTGDTTTVTVHVENHGVEKILTLRVGDAFLHATAPARADLQMEQAVRFSWNPAKVALFDRGTGVSLRHAG